MSLSSPWVEGCERISRRGVEQDQGDFCRSFQGSLGAVIEGGRRWDGMACEL